MLTVRSLFGPVTVEATRDENGNVTGYVVKAPEKMAGRVVVKVGGQTLESDLKALSRAGTVQDAKAFSGKHGVDGPEELSISVCVVEKVARGAR